MARARNREEQPWLRYVLLPLLLIIFGLILSSFILPKAANAPSTFPLTPTPTPTPTKPTAIPPKNIPTLTTTPTLISNTKYTCPDTSWIDCMPVVPPERKQICSKTYLKWAQKNCPNLVGISL